MFSFSTSDFNSSVNKSLNFLNDPNISLAVTLMLGLYAGAAAPKLPRRIAGLLKNPLVSMLFVFLIAYTSTKNPTMAILAALGLVISLQTLNRYEVDDILNVPLQQSLKFGKKIGDVFPDLWNNNNNNHSDKTASDKTAPIPNGVAPVASGDGQSCLHLNKDTYDPEVEHQNASACTANALYGSAGVPAGVESNSSLNALHF